MITRRRIAAAPGGAQLLQRLKQADAARGHRGHTHFWDRAFSRRQMLQSAAAAAGMLAVGRWTPASALPKVGDPKAIPGGFTTPDTGSTVFHNFAPNVFDPPDTDPCGIFDFNGQIGFATVDGTGIGRDTKTGVVTPLSFEGDVRFMQGTYIATDNKFYQATFALL